jgi:hypothetical protein
MHSTQVTCQSGDGAGWDPDFIVLGKVGSEGRIRKLYFKFVTFLIPMYGAVEFSTEFGTLPILMPLYHPLWIPAIYRQRYRTLRHPGGTSMMEKVLLEFLDSKFLPCAVPLSTTSHSLARITPITLLRTV